MTEDSKVHPAPAPVTMGKTKTGLWKKCLGFAGILLVVLFVGGMVGMTQFMTLEDTRIKDIGFLITGGSAGGMMDQGIYTTEIFLPSEKLSCRFPNLPLVSADHSLTSLASSDHTVTSSIKDTLLCGGRETNMNCQLWTGERWKVVSSPLLQRRWKHAAWPTETGVLLIGGATRREKSTEHLFWNGSHWEAQEQFRLEYSSQSSCLIDDETSFLLVGGWQEEYQHEAHRRVTRYDINGFVEDLPSLNRDRYNSGCSSFTADNNKKTYLVTGGGGLWGLTDTTEILEKDSSSWTIVESAELAIPMFGMRSVKLEDAIFMIGGEDRFGNKQTSILKFNQKRMSWTKFGNTMMLRSCHAVAVVKITNDNYNDYCAQKE